MKKYLHPAVPLYDYDLILAFGLALISLVGLGAAFASGYFLFMLCVCAWGNQARNQLRPRH